MTTLFKILAAVGLLLTIVPPFLYLGEAIDHSLNNTLMLVGMISWFIGALKLIKS